MPSTIIPLPSSTWVQVTTTDKEGSIRHKTGGDVIYVEAAAAPISTPYATIKTTSAGDEFQYFGIATGEGLFAFAVNDAAEIVVAPVGA